MSKCESCANYNYDDEYGFNSCMVSLDEDEMQRFLSGTNENCPYYRSDDEYEVVRSQM